MYSAYLLCLITIPFPIGSDEFTILLAEELLKVQYMHLDVVLGDRLQVALLGNGDWSRWFQPQPFSDTMILNSSCDSTNLCMSSFILSRNVEWAENQSMT